jgi:hypothetical protein
MASRGKPITAILVAVGAVLSLPAAGASGEGRCGANFTRPTACHIGRDGTYRGTIVPRKANDLLVVNQLNYYVFYARAGTRVSITLTDSEQTDCIPTALFSSTRSWRPSGRRPKVGLPGLLRAGQRVRVRFCGELDFAVDDHAGSQITSSLSHGSHRGMAAVREHNGAPVRVPTRVRFHISRTGRYFIAVLGTFAHDLTAARSVLPVPYAITIARQAPSPQTRLT